MRIENAAAAAGLLVVLAAPTAAPVAARDTLTVGMQLEPPHLDPTAGAAAAIDSVTYQNVFEGLTRLDRNGGVQPGLATGWEVSDDGLILRFDLVEGATFSDGTGFEASDVVFAFDRARGEDSVNAQKALFEPIDNVMAEADDLVVITLKEPVGGFLFNLAQGDAVIVAPESAETNKEQPVGTGPYRLERWVSGASITLAARDDWRGEAPAIREATFRIVPDPAAAVPAMMAGDLDAYPAFPAPEALAQFEADPRFVVQVGSTEGETILTLNHRREPLSDVRVRRAIQHAIDRDALILGAMDGFATPIGSHFPPHNPAYVDLTGEVPHDPDAARALLAEAGYPDGFSAVIKLPPPSYARRGGEIIAAQLREVGIELEIVPVEWAQWLEQVFTGHDFDMTIVSHVEPGDIGIYANPDYYFGYDDMAFQEIIQDLNRTVDEAARTRLLARAQRKLAQDAVNGFLFQLPLLGVRKAGLQGMWENSPHPGLPLTELSWN